MYEKVLRLMKDPATIASLRRFDEAVAIAAASDKEWRATYPNKWIASYSRGLLAAADTYSELRTLIKDSGVASNEVYTEFLQEPRPVIILV